MQKFLDSFARSVVAGRHAVLVLVVLCSVVAGLFIPRIRADFTPSDLFARVPEQEALAAEFQAQFGNTDNVLLVLVRSDDVWSQPVLQEVHTIASHLAAEPWVGRVDALTTLRLPTQRAGASFEEGPYSALWQLGVGPAAQARAMLSASALSGEERPPMAPPAWLQALGSGAAAVAPAVAGPTVTTAEAAHLREVVSASPLLVGRLVSRDGTLTAIAVQLRDGMDRAADIGAAVDSAAHWLGTRESLGDVEVFMGGLPYLRSALSDRIRADQSVMMPASVLVCVVLLALAFRWLAALLLPLVAVCASAVVLVGGMAAAGESFNIINNIIPLLIVIIGISNAFHLLSRYLEERRSGRAHLDAVEHTVSAMTVACFLTSFTTAVGFATLLVSQTEILRRFGAWAGAGVMVAYVVTLTLLPAAVAVLRAPRVEPGAGSQSGWIERGLGRAVGGVIERPWGALAISAAVLVGGTWIGTYVNVDSAVLDQFDREDELYVTTRLIEDHLGGVRPLEVYLRGSPGSLDAPEVLADIDAIAAWARSQDGVIGTSTYADYLREVRVMLTGDPGSRATEFGSRAEVEQYAALLASGDRDPTEAWVSADRSSGRLQIQLRDFGARRTVEVADALEAELRRVLADGEVEARLTGDAYTSALGLSAVIRDLGGSLGLAVVIIFVFMSLLFRSVRLGLVSIPPNLAPLVLTLAFMVLGGIPLNAATVIIFSVSIGMGVDGTIHIFARVGEELRAGRHTDDAIVRAAQGTGKAILLTNLSLLLGFGVMLLSAFVPVQRFGMLVGVTMFASTFSTVFTLPALLKVATRTPRVHAAR